MTSRVGRRLLLLLSTAAMASVTTAFSNTAVAESGSLGIRVTNPSGTLLPGASVTAVLEAGGPVQHAATGADGTYRFGRLPDGLYRIDIDLRGFDLIRRRHVRIEPDTPLTIDVTTKNSEICECITTPGLPRLVPRAGVVVDTDGWPLPHARIEIVAPTRREVTRADSDGRFVIRAPVDSAWPLTASDDGLRPVTRRVSASDAEPIVFRLAHVDTSELPAQERLDRGCGCDQLFVVPR